MKKTLISLMLILPVFFCSCYDANDVEETAYLICLGIDKCEGGFSYTFQLASPLGSAGGDTGGGKEDSQNSEDKIYDSNNKTVNNIVISAPDFYTAKNMLANYLSKKLVMSHLKMIVCSEEVAKDSFKEHSELFAREREIRPGTFLSVSKDKAEAFLKAVNPELEGNTAKYYELVNSDETLIYAPVKRLGDFSNDSKTLDKTSVLPIAMLSAAESSKELSVQPYDESRMIKSSLTRLSNSKPELFGMGILKDGSLIGTMDGTDAFIYNILSSRTKNFVFSVQSPFDHSECLSFKCETDGLPVFKVINLNDKKNAPPKISVELNISSRYIAPNLPSGFNSFEQLNTLSKEALKKEIEKFLYTTSKNYNADVLKIGDVCKKEFLSFEDFEKYNWNDNFKNASFTVNVFLTDNAQF